MFKFDLSGELKITLARLSKKDPVTARILNAKIKQIINCDEKRIDHFKNLRYDLSEYKRVHIGKSFVLIFKVTKSGKHILFSKFRHHDDVYK